MHDTDWTDTLTPARTDAVRALLLAAREVDGRPEITPDGPLPAEFTKGAHLLAHIGERLIGYAHLDEQGDAFGRQVAELIVHPEHRRRGHGGALFDAVRVRATGTLRLWSHGDHPGAAHIAERAGFARVRELLRMRAELDEVPARTPVLPDGVRLRTFRPGVDEVAVLEVNARAFSWHPEQGALSVDDLRAAEREPWFDADGFFLAERVVSESGRQCNNIHARGEVLGFHWTKVHGGVHPVGEVYVVGVDPGAQGGGLGKALTIAGLEHLRARGLREVILYVEGDNAPAIAVYRGLGFRADATAVQYQGAP